MIDLIYYDNAIFDNPLIDTQLKLVVNRDSNNQHICVSYQKTYCFFYNRNNEQAFCDLQCN